MKILITGSGGRLGRLLHAARKTGSGAACDIVFQSRGAGFDLCWDVSQPLTNLPPCHAMVALWGVTSGSAEALQANSALVDLSRNVARACGVRTLFHMSSAAVYGPGTDMHETTPTAPTSAYGHAKLAMEEKIRKTPVDGLREICLRVANIVGADSLAPGLKAAGPLSLDRFDSGQGPMRSYMGASDLLGVLCSLAGQGHADLPNVLNIAAPEPVAMQDLASAAKKSIDWRPAPKTATERVTLDVSQMTQLTANLPVTSDAQDLIAEWRRLEGIA